MRPPGFLSNPRAGGGDVGRGRVGLLSCVSADAEKSRFYRE